MKKISGFLIQGHRKPNWGGTVYLDRAQADARLRGPGAEFDYLPTAAVVETTVEVAENAILDALVSVELHRGGGYSANPDIHTGGEWMPPAVYRVVDRCVIGGQISGSLVDDRGNFVQSVELTEGHAAFPYRALRGVAA